MKSISKTRTSSSRMMRSRRPSSKKTKRKRRRLERRGLFRRGKMKINSRRTTRISSDKASIRSLALGGLSLTMSLRSRLRGTSPTKSPRMSTWLRARSMMLLLVMKERLGVLVTFLSKKMTIFYFAPPRMSKSLRRMSLRDSSSN